jgi:hypothetical protein
MREAPCSILPAEIKEVLFKSGQNKAHCPSNLTIRHLCIATIANRLAKLFNKILETSIVSPKWNKGTLILIPK